MIPPGSWLGMLGGGQLGRMFTHAAQALGYKVLVLDPDALSPAGAVADRHLPAQYENREALDELARVCAAVTTEFENVPASALELLARRIPARRFHAQLPHAHAHVPTCRRCRQGRARPRPRRGAPGLGRAVGDSDSRALMTFGLRASAQRAGRYGRAAARWARLLASRAPAPGLRVSYGHDRVPGPGEPAAGGSVKFQKLHERFPNAPSDFTLLYLGSSWLPRDLRPTLWVARRRRAPIVVNQNGVGYPGWAGDGTEAFNRPLRLALHAADHVVYQSLFCKRSADTFLGEPRGSWEVLPNAVDVERFTPGVHPPAGGPVLLLGGDQTQGYRIELALRTLAALLPAFPEARLLVTGRVVAPVESLLEELRLGGRVELAGRYSQRDAPALFRRAHVLLHTKVNDPCPSLVLEAMACGLPVVHPASGGTLELVGGEAGVGVPHPDGWERDEPPSPEAMADALARVLADLPAFGTTARRRAVERYALEPWLERHAALFAELLGA